MSASLLLVQSVAYAQGKPTPPATSADDAKKEEARALFERGVGHLNEEAWEVALVEFLRSREIYPTKSATRNAVVCLRHLRRYDEALEMIEALVRDFPDLGGEDKQFAERYASELKTTVGFLDLRGVEPGSNVHVDGRDRGEAKPGTPIRVSAGSRVVRIQKEGFAPFEKRVQVLGDQTLAIDVKMVSPQDAASAKSVGPEPEPTGPAPVADTSMPTQKIAALVVGGVGVVGVGLGAVFGVRAMGLKSDSEADGHCIENSCDAEGADLRNDGRTSGTISTIAFIVGGVAIAGGVGLWLTTPSGSPVNASVGLVPGGVSVRGTW